MTNEEIIAAVEEATGKALNEETIGPLIDGRLKAALKPLRAKDVIIGDAEIPEEPKNVTFSQLLGDIKRASRGLPTLHMKQDQLVKAESDISQEQLEMLDPELTKSLYEGGNAAGGYLVSTEESSELLDLTSAKFSVVPGLCRQIPMKRRQITFPSVTGGLTAYWVPEADADMDTTDPSGFAQADGHKPPSSAVFGQVAITAHTLAVKVAVSNQLLDDSDPGVDGVLRNLFAETIGNAYDLACLRGAGTATDPVTGLASLITTNLLAAGADFNFDDIVDLIFACYENAGNAKEIPVIGHAKGQKVMLKVKDADGQYIYRSPRERGEVPTVWGEPFYRDGNISVTLGAGSDETRLFAGDFANAAFSGHRQGVIIKVNPFAEPYFSHNQTCFLAEARLGFNVSDESRFAVLSGVPTN